MENSLIENSLIMQMFIIYCTFLVIYGFKLKIWRKSKTTEYVIIISAFLTLVHSYCTVTMFMLISGVGLFLLFRRALSKSADPRNTIHARNTRNTRNTKTSIKSEISEKSC